MKKHKPLRLECGSEALSYFADKTRRKISEESHVYLFDKFHDCVFKSVGKPDGHRELRWQLLSTLYDEPTS